MKKKYAYYNSKGKIVTGARLEFIPLLLVFIPVYIIQAIYLFISGKGKYVTKEKYHKTKLKELKNDKINKRTN